MSPMAELEKRSSDGGEVGLEINAINRRHGRDNLGLFKFCQPVSNQRIRHGVMDKVMAEQSGRIGNGSVAAIEDAQFHQFVRCHILNELDADSFQGGAPGGKLSSKHPLAKGFADDRAGIFDIESFLNQSPFAVGCCRA